MRRYEERYRELFVPWQSSSLRHYHGFQRLPDAVPPLLRVSKLHSSASLCPVQVYFARVDLRGRAGFCGKIRQNTMENVSRKM